MLGAVFNGCVCVFDGVVGVCTCAVTAVSLDCCVDVGGGGGQERLKLVDEIITRDEAGRMPLEVMMKDQFANYVVQKVW